MQSPTSFFRDMCKAVPLRTCKKKLGFAMSGCSAFKTPSSFLVQPFGTSQSQFPGGKNWESLGQRMMLCDVGSGNLALLSSPRFQTQVSAPLDSDTFGAALGNLG